MEFILENQDDGSAVDLFMIEEIDAEKNLLVLANYIFDKKINYPVSDEDIEFYADAFDVALSKNMFLFVEFDEKRGVIIG
ncbi:hypothetical protein B4065_2282 [Caldibacillus thermoamylovorans]|uniref:DUF5511 family protein n=1 Tax=Caldibacillus thermoamylovorans TaxID=35841 RepID=UPI0005B72EF3|nr:DUF5511 family protein [Caldibacillus thermoamylovorans]KIO66595.1 hypothetical protein B4065_2282 [Caldibacillus thermoamylovorans]